MELVFNNIPVQYLQCIVRETYIREETSDMIVPDSYPDIAQIISADATVILRGKECRNGVSLISGGAKGTILYRPEENTTIRRMETYIPFSIKLENEEITPDVQAIISLRVRSVDSWIVNSRKVMLRVEVICCIRLYKQTEMNLYETTEVCPELQTRKSEYIITLPLETAEKTFSVHDTIEIPGTRTPASQLYQIYVEPELTECRLIANKAVFKGFLLCRLLYLNTDEIIDLYQQQVPFSQYCEFTQDFDQEDLEVALMVTGCDTEQDSGEIWNKLHFNVNILAQCIVSGSKTISIVDDAYTTKGIFQPHWETQCIEACLDCQETSVTLMGTVPGRLRDIIQISSYWDAPKIGPGSGVVQIPIKGKVQILGWTEEGAIQCLSGLLEGEQSLELCNTAQYFTSIKMMGQPNIILGAAEASVQCDIKVKTICYVRQDTKTLSGAVIEAEEFSSEKPSLVIKKNNKENSLWEIAKSNRTTVEKVSAANHCEEGLQSGCSLMLIPL